jgi:hypothetical protein
MKQKKTAEVEEEKFVPAIDPDILARINAKIARAHEQNEKPYVFQRPKKAPEPKNDSDPVKK